MIINELQTSSFENRRFFFVCVNICVYKCTAELRVFFRLFNAHISKLFTTK